MQAFCVQQVAHFGSMKISYLISLVFVLWSTASWSYALRGKVETMDGEAIPGVSIYISQTSFGVITNAKGEFFMELEEGSYALIFRSVGFETKTVEVSIPTDAILTVVLADEVTELTEVTISAKSKDPAYAIIKQASENRKKYQQPFDALSYNAYVKASLEKEVQEKEVDSTTLKKVEVITKEKMNLVEKLSEMHFKAPGDRKEVIKAYRNYSDKPELIQVNGRLADFGFYYDEPEISDPSAKSDVNPLLFYLNPGDNDFNFYKGNLLLPGVYDLPYVSPLHPLATASYKFRLIESFREDGQLVHKIEVEPRRKTDALVAGHIFIVDGAWAIKAVDFSFPGTANYTYTKLQLAQNYLQLEDGRWVCSREEFFYESYEENITFIGNTVALYSEFNTEPVFAKRFFDNELTRFDPDAEKNADAILDARRPITLKVEEVSFAKTQDSITKAHLAPGYLMKKDSSFNHISPMNIFFTGVENQNSAKGRYIYMIPIIAQFRLYQPGGYRHALGGQYSKFYRETGKQLDIYSQVDYGILNKDLRGHVNSAYTYNNFNFSKVSLGFGSQYELMNKNPTVVANFSPGNYSLTNHITVGYGREIVNGFFVDGEVRYAKHNPVNDLKYPSFSDSFLLAFEEIYGSELDLPGQLRPTYFEPYSKLMVDLDFTFRPKQEYRTLPNRKVVLGSKYPRFNLRIKSGLPGVFGSRAAFLYTELRIQDRMKMGSFGESQYNVKMGGFLWDDYVEIVDQQFILGGELVWYTNPMRSFQLLGPSYRTTEPYIEAHYRHLFDGSIINKIPLLRPLRLGMVGGVNGLWMADGNFAYMEVYGGIEKKFRAWTETVKVGVYHFYPTNGPLENPLRWKIGLFYFNTVTNTWQ